MWTSGRKCNFLNKGCDSAELQPVNVNGWFWADGNKRIPSTTTPSKLTFWSGTGETGQRQPDNWQGKKEGGLENVRVRNTYFSGGRKIKISPKKGKFFTKFPLLSRIPEKTLIFLPPTHLSTGRTAPAS